MMKTNKKPTNTMRLKQIGYLWCLSAALTACSSVSAPPSSASAALGFSTDIQGRYAVDEAWWHGYHDTELNRLVELALANNTDLAASAIRVNQALYQANLVGANLNPTLSGSLTGSVKQDLRNGGSSQRSYGGSLGVSYEVDVWQKLANSKSAKEWAYQASIADKAAMRLATIYAVIDVYFQLSFLDAQIKSNQQTIQTYQSLQKIVQSKYQLGKVASIEVHQAEQSLLNSQSQLLSLQKQQTQSIQALNNLLNLKSTDSAHIQIKPLQDIQALGVNLNVPVSVIANRPDLRAAEFRLQQGFKTWQASSKEWYPSISLSTVVNSSNQKIGSALQFPIGVGRIDINLPFLDWQKVKWNIKISEAEYELSRLNFEKAITEAVNEVVAENQIYQQASRDEKNLAKKVASEEKISRYYLTRYQSGKEEQSKWLSAQNNLLNTKMAYLQSQYARVISENKVFKSMAGRFSE